MNSSDVRSIFLYNDKCDSILFQSALFWAEKGETVWFISPESFDTLPNDWKAPPDKEILKLMIFMYIPSSRDLLLKLSGIHLCNKIPKLVILMNLEYYLFENLYEDALSRAAFTSALLLNALSTFSKKYHEKSFLIVTSNNFKVDNQKLNTIVDLYFSDNMFNLKNCNKNIVEIIFKIFEECN